MNGQKGEQILQKELRADDYTDYIHPIRLRLIMISALDMYPHSTPSSKYRPLIHLST